MRRLLDFNPSNLNLFITNKGKKINLVSTEAHLLSSAYTRLADLLHDRLIELAPQKCVWFGGKNDIPMPSSLNNHGITAEADVIKILGAFLGETARVSEKLVQKLEKHRTAFRRLKQMGASNVSLLLLSKSINVRHRYHIRVQNPDESLKLTQKFDHEVASVFRTWFGNLSDKKIKWTRLPLKKGGLGLTAYEHIREASYTASRQTALERPKHLSALAGNLACVSLAEETSTQTLPNEHCRTKSPSRKLYTMRKHGAIL